MDWLEVAVAADDEAVEAVAEVLRAHGHGVAIEEPFIQTRLDDPPLRDPSRRPVLKTYLPDDGSAPEARRQIEESLWHLGQLCAVEPPSIRRVAEEDWANAWKAFFPVLQVTSQIVVVPAWRRYRRRPGEVTVRLEPGLAFGTGMHPTTRLCLLAAERLMRPGSRVLDVGTGSGILAIAAARLGARRVVALDIDPQAVAAARANVRRNRLGGVVEVVEGTLGLAADEQHSGFDLVLANLTARTNTKLAPSFAAALRPSGRLVASGILEDSVDVVAEACTRVGLAVVERQAEGDWVALVAAKMST